MRAESDWEKVGGIADESIRLKKGRVPVFKKMRDRMVKGVMGIRRSFEKDCDGV